MIGISWGNNRQILRLYRSLNWYLLGLGNVMHHPTACVNQKKVSRASRGNNSILSWEYGTKSYEFYGNVLIPSKTVLKHQNRQQKQLSSPNGPCSVWPIHVTEWVIVIIVVWWYLMIFTIWLFNIAMENHHF